MPVDVVMNRRSHPNHSPAWELNGVSVQHRVVVHEGVVGGPRGIAPAVKDSKRTI